MKKRILSIMLTLAMVVSLMSATTMTAFADGMNPVVGIPNDDAYKYGHAFRKWLNQTEYKDYTDIEIFGANPGCWLLQLYFGDYRFNLVNYWKWDSAAETDMPNVHPGTNGYISKFYPIGRVSQQHVDWVEVLDAYADADNYEKIWVLVKPKRASLGFNPDLYDGKEEFTGYDDLEFRFDITINGTLYENFLLPVGNGGITSWSWDYYGNGDDWESEIVSNKEKYLCPQFFGPPYRTKCMVQDETPGHNSFYFSEGIHHKELNHDMTCKLLAYNCENTTDPVNKKKYYSADTYFQNEKIAFKPVDPDSNIMDYITITRDYDGTAVEYQYDSENDYYWFISDGYNVTISATPEFTATADSGYYAPEKDSPDNEKSGIIAFTANLTNLADAFENCNFGEKDEFGIAMFSTASDPSSVNKDNITTKVSKTTFSDLKKKDGYFYSFVKNIDSTHFADYAYGVPFAIINGKTYWGSIINTSVNGEGTPKWLGTVANMPEEAK